MSDATLTAPAAAAAKPDVPAVPAVTATSTSAPNGLKDGTLTWNGEAYDVSECGGIRWDNERKRMFLVNASGKETVTLPKGTVSDYRFIEALCVPYWRSKGQCIE